MADDLHLRAREAIFSADNKLHDGVNNAVSAWYSYHVNAAPALCTENVMKGILSYYHDLLLRQ